MKKFFLAFMLAAGALTMVVSDADAARRLGGGSSIGRQSQNLSRRAPAPAQPSQNQMNNQNQNRSAAAPGAPAQPRPATPWRNILGGALLGLGLGALLSHLGIGGALAGVISTILMIALLALAAMFILRMFRRKGGEQQARPAYGGAYSSPAARAPEIGSRLEQGRPAAFQGEPGAGSQPWGLPADLDVPAFLRNAKTYFIRLQAAWDRADINDIREFTTTEMFAELRMQLQERGPSGSHTDVVSLDAELLGVETVADEYFASVRFSGMIREDENAPAEPFTEVWNLVKPVSGPGGWVLAGIQQLSQA
ncbi:Tim44 domain-containing protein [Noviherbaspirillum massiliense]|uniref:Tim44 domain-containing protein n=1 Tax=Noviherbaspirillum massiliense TaxID=1465823 RepID=UPI0002D6DA65|nr:Tim44-like domain-containing protein [Noviherbaspirillum massiliense]